MLICLRQGLEVWFREVTPWHQMNQANASSRQKPKKLKQRVLRKHVVLFSEKAHLSTLPLTVEDKTWGGSRLWHHSHSLCIMTLCSLPCRPHLLKPLHLQQCLLVCSVQLLHSVHRGFLSRQHQWSPVSAFQEPWVSSHPQLPAMTTNVYSHYNFPIRNKFK